MRERIGRSCAVAGAAIGVWLLASPGLQAEPSHGKWQLANHTPRFIAAAKDVGPEDQAKQVTIRVWLNRRDQASLDALLKDLYDPASPSYHKWLTQAEFDNRFSSQAGDAAAVQKFLESQSLKVSANGSRHYVEAQGRIADVQRAFNVQIHRFDLNGRTYRANTSDPSVDDEAGALIAAVGGLTDHGVKPHNRHPVDPDGKPFKPVPLAAVPNGFFFSAQCFRAPEVQTFTTGGGLPAAAYEGHRYGADITNQDFGSLPPCGYQPSEVQKAYKLDQLYAAGLDGTGQTIVIVDAFGSQTIAFDAGFFSDFYGLAPLNLQVIGTPAPITNGDIQGWAEETTLDVEWSHSVAPGANVVLEVAASDNDDDIDVALLDAVVNNRGNVISNSYGEPESLVDPSELQKEDAILKLAAAKGIAVNYSSGDDGDFAIDLGYTDVSSPASSPFATGVGGTSLALRKDNSMAFQTGWGTNLSRIADYDLGSGSPPVVPPAALGFIFGAGGGQSGVYAKPRFQHGLHGHSRMVPDISYLADPYTGVEIIETFGSDLEYGAIGGTSLACPMFSGLWAIAMQKAGGPLGQPARLLYDLPDRAITDVRPFETRHNVKGLILNTTGVTFESTRDLAAPLGKSTHEFFSALYNGTSTRWYVLTFGTDSSLATRDGWDDVTGLGTPNGMAFVDAVAHRAH